MKFMNNYEIKNYLTIASLEIFLIFSCKNNKSIKTNLINLRKYIFILDNIELSNQSNKMNDGSLGLSLQQMDNENDEEMDLNLFLEPNNESFLPYLETLMKIVNEEIAAENKDIELNPDESSIKSSILNNVANVSSDKSKSLKVESYNNSMEKILNNDSNSYDTEFLEKEKFNKIFTENQIISTTITTKLNQKQQVLFINKSIFKI